MYFNYVQYQPIPCEVVEAKKICSAPLSKAERKRILKLQKIKQKKESLKRKLVNMDEQQAKQKEIKK